MKEISLRDEGGQTVLELKGSIDGSHVSELLNSAITASRSEKPVVLDWPNAEHLHAGALQVLLALDVELTAQGRQLQISECSPAVRECIEVAGLVQAFRIGPERKETGIANRTDGR